MKRTFAFRSIAALLAALTLMLSTAQCFGGFTLTKKVYELNKSVASSGTMQGRVIQEIVFLVLVIIPVYGIATFLDVILFNLVEFWTGKSLLAVNQTSPDGKVTFRQISPNEMQVDVKSEQGLISLFVFADRPGEFFTKNGDRYIRVQLPADLKAFDAQGNTSISCSNDANGLRCQEGNRPGAWMRRDVKKSDLLRTEALVRAHMERPAMAVR